MGVRKVALRDVAADNSAELDRKIIADLKAWRERYPMATRVVLDTGELDAMLRVIDSATVNH